MEIMKRLVFYLKENWASCLITLLLSFWFISFILEPYGLPIAAALVVLWQVCWFLSIKVFKLNRKGPIPWYGSPVVWLGVPVLVALVYLGVVYI